MPKKELYCTSITIRWYGLWLRYELYVSANPVIYLIAFSPKIGILLDKSRANTMTNLRILIQNT